MAPTYVPPPVAADTPPQTQTQQRWQDEEEQDEDEEDEDQEREPQSSMERILLRQAGSSSNASLSDSAAGGGSGGGGAGSSNRLLQFERAAEDERLAELAAQPDAWFDAISRAGGDPQTEAEEKPSGGPSGGRVLLNPCLASNVAAFGAFPLAGKKQRLWLRALVKNLYMIPSRCVCIP